MFDHLATGKWWDIGLDLMPGCTPVSPACEHCWSAEKTHRAGFQRNPKIWARYGGLTDARGRFTGEVRPQWDFLDRIGRAQKPKCYSFWNDLFHEGISFEFADAVMSRIQLHEGHFYIICTKRPERALQYFSGRSFRGGGHFKYNLMLMTTVENQYWADLRLPILLQIPGVLHGVSYEPALGPVDFTNYLEAIGSETCNQEDDHQSGICGCFPGLDWLIAGGETGPHARPSHPDWFRLARDQAVAAGVPFFFKSWGEWLPYDSWENACCEAGWGDRKDLKVLWPVGVSGSAVLGDVVEAWNAGCRGVKRVGKKAAGRLLDGRMWNEVPI